MRVLRWIRVTYGPWHASPTRDDPGAVCGVWLGWHGIGAIQVWPHETTPTDGRVCRRCLAWLRRREEG